MLSDRGTFYLACAVLALLALVALAWLYVIWRKARFTPAQAPLMVLNACFCRVLWRQQTRGRICLEHLPRGALIVCNHASPFDPWFIGTTLPQIVHWMVAREYCENWFFGPILSALEVIPAGRSGQDTAAIRSAIRYLRKGRLVGMLPEGRINETGELLLPARPGALLVALKARVPVIPCYVRNPPYDGTVMGNLIKPARVELVIGQPLDLSEYYDRRGDRQVLGQLTLRVMQEIARLAGHPEYTPRLAGRRWSPQLEQHPVQA